MARSKSMTAYLQRAYDAGFKLGRMQSFKDSLKEVRRLERGQAKIDTEADTGSLQKKRGRPRQDNRAPSRGKSTGKRTASVSGRKHAKRGSDADNVQGGTARL